MSEARFIGQGKSKSWLESKGSSRPTSPRGSKVVRGAIFWEKCVSLMNEFVCNAEGATLVVHALTIIRDLFLRINKSVRGPSMDL